MLGFGGVFAIMRLLRTYVGDCIHGLDLPSFFGGGVWVGMKVWMFSYFRFVGGALADAYE